MQRIEDPTKRSGEFNNTPLIEAIAYDDIDEANRILNKYPEHAKYINLHDEAKHSGCGNSALQLAVMRGHIDLAKRLLKLGADAATTNADNSTALHYVCLFRDNELIKIMQKKMGDKIFNETLNKPNKDGHSPKDLYLYNFKPFHSSMRKVREISMISEHRPTWSFDQRGELDLNVMPQQELIISETLIENINVFFKKLLRSTPIAFIYNNKDNHRSGYTERSSLLDEVFVSSSEFREQYKKLGGGDAASSTMRSEIRKHLEKNYLSTNPSLSSKKPSTKDPAVSVLNNIHSKSSSKLNPNILFADTSTKSGEQLEDKGPEAVEKRRFAIYKSVFTEAIAEYENRDDYKKMIDTILNSSKTSSQLLSGFKKLQKSKSVSLEFKKILKKHMITGNLEMIYPGSKKKPSFTPR